MALSIQVIVHEVTNLSDARYAAGMMVDFIGFNLDKNGERSISQEEFVAITGWLEGPSYVGSFTTSTPEDILEVAANLDLKWIQVETVAQLDGLSGYPGECIFKADFNASTSETLSSLSAAPSYVLLQVEKSFSDLSPEEIEDIKRLCNSNQVLLDIELGSVSVDELISSLEPKGLALKGGDEERPGYKDFDEMADILEALEVD